jgi:hypothetical protein
MSTMAEIRTPERGGGEPAVPRALAQFSTRERMVDAMRTFRFERGPWGFAVWLIVAGCVLSVGIVVAGAGAGPGSKYTRDFLGFWEGVDALDGSPVRLSLSDLDDRGIVGLTMQEDFFTSCFDLGPTYSRGRGVIRGAATARSKGVLDVTTELICFDDSNVPFSVGPPVSIQYTLRARGRNLVLPPFGSAPAIVLHRIAE